MPLFVDIHGSQFFIQKIKKLFLMGLVTDKQRPVKSLFIRNRADIPFKVDPPFL